MIIMKCEIMKKYIFSLLIVLLFSACSDSFFEKYPTDSIAEENYLNTSDEIQNVLYSAYANMRGDFANSLVYLGDLPTDNAYDYKLNNSSDHIALNESGVDPQNGVTSALWAACYEIINRCCIVLDNIDKVDISDDRYNQMVGEAEFLRAYTYYVMVRVWGDVPLVLEDVKDFMDVYTYGRTNADTVYNQVINDLKDAAAKLPPYYTSSAEIGKATSTAANAILGDVYMTRHDYANAKIYLKKVIDEEGPHLGLLDDYASIFDSRNANNKEIIFAIQYASNQSPKMSNYLGSGTLGNIQQQYIDPGNGGSELYGVNIMLMTHELEAKYAANDLRRSVLYTDIIDADYHYFIPMTLKYFDYQNVTDHLSGTPDSGCETIISRYSDVLLEYAECLNETNDQAGAIELIKRVRNRAGLTTDIAANHESVFLAIEKERQLELCMEGHRWFDLLRTGRTEAVMNAYYTNRSFDENATLQNYEYGEANSCSVEDYELLFPIPYDQIILNSDKIHQNPGY